MTDPAKTDLSGGAHDASRRVAEADQNSPSGSDITPGVRAPDTEALAKLEEVARAATPGEWGAVLASDQRGQPTPFYAGLICLIQDGGPGERVSVVASGGYVPSRLWEANATHIAAFDPPTVLALIARIRELEAGGWQPIGTAPRDGTLILCSDGETVGTARYRPSGRGWIWDDGNRFGCLMCFWSPLPEPPRDTSPASEVPGKPNKTKAQT